MWGVRVAPRAHDHALIAMTVKFPVIGGTVNSSLTFRPHLAVDLATSCAVRCGAGHPARRNTQSTWRPSGCPKDGSIRFVLKEIFDGWWPTSWVSFARESLCHRRAVVRGPCVVERKHRDVADL